MISSVMRFLHLLTVDLSIEYFLATSSIVPSQIIVSIGLECFSSSNFIWDVLWNGVTTSSCVIGRFVFGASFIPFLFRILLRIEFNGVLAKVKIPSRLCPFIAPYTDVQLHI